MSDDEDRAPICPYCGVTALPSEDGPSFVCENPDCEAFGDTVRPIADDDLTAKRPPIDVGDIVVSPDGRMVGLVRVVADCGWDHPLWELHVDWIVDGAREGVSISEPSAVRVDNTPTNRAMLEQFDIRLS